MSLLKELAWAMYPICGLKGLSSFDFQCGCLGVLQIKGKRHLLKRTMTSS